MRTRTHLMNDLLRPGTPVILALTLLVAARLAASAAADRSMQPIALHPENPHYFLFRGKPAVLITSAEHYGAVLNLDFDFIPYLEELRARDFNLTRIFLGAYVEPPGAFNIQNNTLAPGPGRFICPWPRSDTPGYAAGGNKFDLSRWDEAYFTRLKRFMREAGRRGVVVEVVLFCPYYEDPQWSLSPLNAANNINGIGAVLRTEALTLKHPPLVAVQDAMVRRVVKDLREFDNVYFEICNEPYFGGVTREWQQHVAATVAAEERDLPARRRHLIAENIANGSARIEVANPLVSVFNFHYAAPPDAVKLNFGLDRPIGFDETGFKGVEDRPYRTEGWDFILAGGAVYNHLDYSFTTVHPSGTAPVTPPTPGGGGPAMRSQLSVLKRFIEGFDFIHMAPDPTFVRGGLPDGCTARVLSRPGKDYAAYLKGSATAGAPLTLGLPAGRYRAEWIVPTTGTVEAALDLTAAGAATALSAPAFAEDLALRLIRK